VLGIGIFSNRGIEAVTVSDHLSIGDVGRYRSRNLPVAERLAINDHLAGCVTCRELFEEPRRLEATYSFARTVLGDTRVESGPHLSYEQIAAYTDELLSDQERSIVDIHLEGCRTCEAEVDDLQRTRAGSFSRVSSARSDASVSHTAQRSRYSIPLQIAIMIAIAAAAGLVTTFLLQGRLTQQQALLNEVRARGEELQRGLQESKGAVADLQARLERIQESPGEPSAGGPEGVRILLKDASGVVTLNTQGTIAGLEFAGPRDERLIRDALTTGSVRIPALLSKLVGKPNQLMGTAAKDSFTLLSPVGTLVLTNRPTLRWESLSGASGYLVTILDSGFNEVETSPLLSETEWKVTRPLRPGGTYMWQVRALKDGNEIRSPSTGRAEAKFRVLERSKAIEVERMRQTYANSHLALGVVLAEAGLLEEANREFEALSSVNPHSRIVRSLINSVKRRRAR
jgi:hypothetical protein